MTKQEQIQEMAVTMQGSCCVKDCKIKCMECPLYQSNCIAYKYAERLYNASYHKDDNIKEIVETERKQVAQKIYDYVKREYNSSEWNKRDAYDCCQLVTYYAIAKHIEFWYDIEPKIDIKMPLTNREWLNTLPVESFAKQIGTHIAVWQEPIFNRELDYTDIASDIQDDLQEWLDKEHKE